jgi:hypothetical protein
MGTRLIPIGRAIAQYSVGGVAMFGDLTVAAIVMIVAEIVVGGVIAGLFVNHLRHQHWHR